jgi:hypothetical protein
MIGLPPRARAGWLSSSSSSLFASRLSPYSTIKYSMEGLELQELHSFAATLAIDAGSYLREQALARASRNPANGQHYDLELEIKENSSDLLTKVDLHCEALISGAIQKRFPDHK